MLHVRVYRGKVPKKDRVWLASCIALSKLEEHKMRSLGLRSHGGRKPTNATRQVPQKSLLRQCMRQGAPYKCPLIREVLWEWFVDIRRSLCTTISPKFVLCKARQIADDVLKFQRATSGFVPMPVLDRHWLLRWKRDKGIVFRKPNMRFKCSKAVLVERLRAMWLNLIRVRRLAERLFGNDLSKAIFGIDEKPIHFNEAGSKNMRTLEIAGATAVRLKQNHAATRERASLMTCVTSCPEAASQPRRLPMEVLFKAKSNRRIRGLEPPGDLNISLQWAEKGSYRQEHILRYLQRWLDPWTPERAAAHDYRILFMDVAKSHVADEVLEFAWTRGYVTLLHYGCTTGVCQVNDTDLHADFERVYLECEQEFFNEQQLYEPGCVSRSPQDVLNDSAATWQLVDHKQGVEGHLRTGLSNRLDGSEDHRITREALFFWTEASMPEHRRRAIEEIDAAVASGLQFSEWRSIVRHPVDPGILEDEGAEFEGNLEPDEKLWTADDHEALLKQDDQAVLEGSEANPDEALNVGSALAVKPLPEDDPADVQQADAAVRRLNTLKRLRSELALNRVPAAFNQVDREVGQLERGLRANTGKERTANVVLRRHLAQVAQVMQDKITARRAEFRKRAKNVQKAKLIMAKLNKRKALAKAKAKAKATSLAALPKTFSSADCSQRGVKGTKARQECLERLKLRAPALDAAQQAQWPKIRDAYAHDLKHILGHKEEKTLGPPFLQLINGVLKRLGKHYDGPTPYNTGKGSIEGVPHAFADFVQTMSNAISDKGGSTVTM